MASMIDQPTGTTSVQGTVENPAPRRESIKPPSIWDDDAPLLGGIPRPLFQFKLRPIAAVRVITVGVAIASFVFQVQPYNQKRDAAVPGSFFTMLLILWNSVAIVYSGLPVSFLPKKPSKLNFGPFTCTYERKNVPSHRRPFDVMLTDFGFALLTLIPLIMGAKNPHSGWERVWKNSFAHLIIGLSAGVFVLQLILAFLNAFAVCRKAKICVYQDDEEKPRLHRIQLPRD